MPGKRLHASFRASHSPGLPFPTAPVPGFRGGRWQCPRPEGHKHLTLSEHRAAFGSPLLQSGRGERGPPALSLTNGNGNCLSHPCRSRQVPVPSPGPQGQAAPPYSTQAPGAAPVPEGMEWLRNPRAESCSGSTCASGRAGGASAHSDTRGELSPPAWRAEGSWGLWEGWRHLARWLSLQGWNPNNQCMGWCWGPCCVPEERLQSPSPGGYVFQLPCSQRRGALRPAEPSAPL